MQTYFNTSLANMDILFCLLSSHLWEQAPALRSQTSFEHIIRDREDYEEIVKYIYENPIRWYYDELYTEEYGKRICLKPAKAER